MTEPPRAETTQMLRDAHSGDAAARDQLFARVYDELHRIAGRQLRRGAGGTLQATALVNEACLHLLEPKLLGAADRSHFLTLAAVVMRRVLVDHHRRAHAERRGGGRLCVTLDDAQLAAGGPQALDVLALDSALERLGVLDERKAKIVELRFFAGLDVAEVADVLGVSKRTVEADWSFARAWLLSELRDDGGG